MYEKPRLRPGETRRGGERSGGGELGKDEARTVSTYMFLDDECHVTCVLNASKQNRVQCDTIEREELRCTAGQAGGGLRKRNYAFQIRQDFVWRRPKRSKTVCNPMPQVRFPCAYLCHLFMVICLEVVVGRLDDRLTYYVAL